MDIKKCKSTVWFTLLVTRDTAHCRPSHLLDLVLGVHLKEAFKFLFFVVTFISTSVNQVSVWLYVCFQCLTTCFFSFITFFFSSRNIHSRSWSMITAPPKDTFEKSFIALSPLPKSYWFFYVSHSSR